MRLEHKGGAVVTTTTAEVDAGALTIPLTDASGWPEGVIGPFWVTLNKGKNIEEKVLCATRTGLVLSVWTDGSSNGRGRDNTTPRTHPINSTVEHTWTAEEADAANVHQQATDGAHGYPAIANVVVQGGTALGMSHVSVAGAQAEAEFRVRNVKISAVPPTPADGEDGDLWIVKGA